MALTTEQRLDKTARSIAAAMARGGNMRHRRVQELVWRYNMLSDILKLADRWDSYCQERGYDPRHTGIDVAC